MARFDWFKVEIGIIDDPKLAALSDAEFRLWISFIAVAKDFAQHGHRGVIPLTADLIGWRLRRTPQEITAAIARFESLCMVARTPAGVHLVNFEKIQNGKPSDQPEQTRGRKRKSRSRAAVTPVSRDVTRVTSRQSHATYTDTDRETEEETEKETTTATSSPVVAEATPVASGPPLAVLIPSEPEWPPDLADVRKALDALQAPDDLHDPPFWRGIDEWLGKHPRVAYLDELAKYLTWWRAQSGRKRHRKLKAGFRNWLTTSENRDEREAQRRHQLDERPGFQRRR